MAVARGMTVDEVMLELEVSDDEMAMDSEGESDDDFEGYLEEDTEEGTNDESIDEESNDDESSTGDDMDVEIPSIPDFTLHPGVSVAISGNSPIDFFSLFVDGDMLQHIVDHTNLYAEQYLGSHTVAPHSRVRQWLRQAHTVPELQRFIALILAMGLVRYPLMESYWSTSWPYATEAFSSVSYLQ